MVVIKPSEHVQKLLIITKLTAIFKIVDTQRRQLAVYNSNRARAHKIMKDVLLGLQWGMKVKGK